MDVGREVDIAGIAIYTRCSLADTCLPRLLVSDFDASWRGELAQPSRRLWEIGPLRMLVLGCFVIGMKLCT